MESATIFMAAMRSDGSVRIDVLRGGMLASGSEEVVVSLSSRVEAAVTVLRGEEAFLVEEVVDEDMVGGRRTRLARRKVKKAVGVEVGG